MFVAVVAFCYFCAYNVPVPTLQARLGTQMNTRQSYEQPRVIPLLVLIEGGKHRSDKKRSDGSKARTVAFHKARKNKYCPFGGDCA